MSARSRILVLLTASALGLAGLGQTPYAQTVVAVTGQPAPGGGSYKLLHQISSNDLGMVVFIAGLSGEPHQGVFLYDGFQSYKLLATGGSAPGTAGTFTNFKNVSLNNLGQVIVLADLSTGKDGVFSLIGSQLITIALEGNQVGNSRLLDFFESAVNDGGTVVFSASTFEDGRILCRSTDGATEAISPGRADSLPTHIKLTSSGEVYFIDNEFMGPGGMPAPATLYKISKGITKLLDSTAVPNNSSSRLRVGVPGRGIRSFDVSTTGEIRIVADVQSDRVVQRLFTFNESGLTEDLMAHQISDRFIAVQSAGGIFLVLAGHSTGDSFVKTLYQVTGAGIIPIVRENFLVGDKIYLRIHKFSVSGKVVYVLASALLGPESQDIIVGYPLN